MPRREAAKNRTRAVPDSAASRSSARRWRRTAGQVQGSRAVVSRQQVRRDPGLGVGHVRDRVPSRDVMVSAPLGRQAPSGPAAALEGGRQQRTGRPAPSAKARASAANSAAAPSRSRRRRPGPERRPAGPLLAPRSEYASCRNAGTRPGTVPNVWVAASEPQDRQEPAAPGHPDRGPAGGRGRPAGRGWRRTGGGPAGPGLTRQPGHLDRAARPRGQRVLRDQHRHPDRLGLTAQRCSAAETGARAKSRRPVTTEPGGERL